MKGVDSWRDRVASSRTNYGTGFTYRGKLSLKVVFLDGNLKGVIINKSC